MGCGTPSAKHVAQRVQRPAERMIWRGAVTDHECGCRILASQAHVPDDVYARAAGEFSEPELAQLIGLIMTINAWNRLAISTRAQPGT